MSSAARRDRNRAADWKMTVGAIAERPAAPAQMPCPGRERGARRYTEARDETAPGDVSGHATAFGNVSGHMLYRWLEGSCDRIPGITKQCRNGWLWEDAMASRSSVVFVGIRGAVLAVDRDSGHTQWTTELKGRDFVNVILQDDWSLRGVRGCLYRLDPSSGDILWSHTICRAGAGASSRSRARRRPPPRERPRPPPLPRTRSGEARRTSR
jgi:hypothetical protein